MAEIYDTDKIDGYSETRDRKYPTYIPGDTRIEGFCSFNELKRRIERLEQMVEQLIDTGKGENVEP